MTATVPRQSRTRRNQAGHWHGPMRDYDLVKEFTVAILVVALLTVVLAAVFSSPDEKNITLHSWAKAVPNDFVATAARNWRHQRQRRVTARPTTPPARARRIGPIELQRWAGVRIPVDPRTTS